MNMQSESQLPSMIAERKRTRWKPAPLEPPTSAQSAIHHRPFARLFLSSFANFDVAICAITASSNRLQGATSATQLVRFPAWAGETSGAAQPLGAHGRALCPARGRSSISPR